MIRIAISDYRTLERFEGVIVAVHHKMRSMRALTCSKVHISRLAAPHRTHVYIVVLILSMHLIAHHSRGEASLVSLPLDLLQREMSRVFRSLAIRYGKSKRTQVQTVKQRFTLAEEYRHQREVQGVDQSSLQILSHR
jgi:hypothetical protein